MTGTVCCQKSFRMSRWHVGARFQDYDTTSTLKRRGGDSLSYHSTSARHRSNTPFSRKDDSAWSSDTKTQFFLEGKQENSTYFLYRGILENLRRMVTARYPASPEETSAVYGTTRLFCNNCSDALMLQPTASKSFHHLRLRFVDHVELQMNSLYLPDSISVRIKQHWRKGICEKFLIIIAR